MKNKVISLFGHTKEVAYSDLLKEFTKPFESEFPDSYEFKDIIEFSIQTWNFANINNVFPPGKYEELAPSPELSKKEKDLFQKMMSFKAKKFDNYDRYFLDYEFEENHNEEIELTVATGNTEEFIDGIKNDFIHEQSQEDFDENYINRYAVVIKPKQPLLDWINSMDPEHKIKGIDEVNVYLVDDNITDLEKWLKMKFDEFFLLELEDWCTDKKDWPQKRNYKMFKEWFQIDISTMIYDLGERPIIKD